MDPRLADPMGECLVAFLEFLIRLFKKLFSRKDGDMPIA